MSSPLPSHHGQHGAHGTLVTQELTKLLSRLWVPQPYRAITGAGDLQSQRAEEWNNQHPSSISLYL